MQVELARVVTADDVVLDGFLSKPGTEPASGPVDLVIMHHGVGGNFYSPSFFETVTSRLLELGIATLRVNNRGHDYLYNPPGLPGEPYAATTARRRRGQLGAAAETIADCLPDWEAWLRFAEGLGYTRICLWGHSLGAVKTIYFLAKQSARSVVCAVASSPPRFSYTAFMKSEMGSDFKENLERAVGLVSAGQPDSILTVTFPTVGRFTARTFVDKYGPEELYDILSLLPRVSTPMLLTLGGEEESPPFRDTQAAGPGLNEVNAAISFRVIEGGDHVYTAKEADLFAAFRGWLSETLERTSATPQSLS